MHQNPNVAATAQAYSALSYNLPETTAPAKPDEENNALHRRHQLGQPRRLHVPR